MQGDEREGSSQDTIYLICYFWFDRESIRFETFLCVGQILVASPPLRKREMSVAMSLGLYSVFISIAVFAIW